MELIRHSSFTHQFEAYGHTLIAAGPEQGESVCVMPTAAHYTLRSTGMGVLQLVSSLLPVSVSWCASSGGGSRGHHPHPLRQAAGQQSLHAYVAGEALIE
jgi:hypothetical protein